MLLIILIATFVFPLVLNENGKYCKLYLFQQRQFMLVYMAIRGFGGGGGGGGGGVYYIVCVNATFALP